MTRRLALLATACAVALAGRAPAANAPVSGLGARGIVAGTDQLPDLPSGAGSLQAAYASDLKKYALTSIDTFGADPTGVADSTGAIQSAINSGQSLSCDGVYKTTATLVFATVASHGQQLLGAGPTDNGGVTTAGRCVFRPTSAVSVAIKVDGTPFSGYVEGFGIENVTVDMTNMTDANTSIAFDQVQAYDGHYRNDRVINFGNYKLSWSFNAGSYTSKIEDSQGGIVSLTGASFSNAATTITLINCDIYSIFHDFYQNVTVMGGAIQRPYSASVPILYLPPGTTPYAYVPNTAGLYAAVLSEIYDSESFTSVGADWEQGGSFPSTYNDGTHGTLTLIRVLKVDNTAIDTTFINPGFAGMYLLDYGLNTRVIGQQESTVTGVDIHNGAAFEQGSVGVAGSLFGYTSLANYLDFGTTTTFSLNGSNGTATFLGETITPASDGDKVLLLTNAMGTNLFDYNTSGPTLVLENGVTLAGYSDTFTTLKWSILSTNGNATFGNVTGTLGIFKGQTVQPTSNADNTISWKNAAGASQLDYDPLGPTIAINNGTVLSGFSDTFTTTKWVLNSSTGAANFVGSLSVNSTLQVSGTAPIYSSGFSSGTPTITGSTTSAFTVAIGATPSATGVLAMPTASTGWNCTGVDRTTAAGTIRETATTATSVTFALGSTVASDVLQLECIGY